MNKLTYGIVPQPAPFKPRPELLCHPNIPKPLHGIAPREIAGRAWWDQERQAAYERTGLRCAACGVHKNNIVGSVKRLEAHECYDFDYTKGRLTLREIVALCPYCHSFIHSGRLEVLYNTDAISAETYEAIIAHGTAIVKSAGLLGVWKNRHSLASPVRWADWRIVFEGREYGPSSRSMEDWMNGAWKNWKPPATAR